MRYVVLKEFWYLGKKFSVGQEFNSEKVTSRLLQELVNVGRLEKVEQDVNRIDEAHLSVTETSRIVKTESDPA